MFCGGPASVTRAAQKRVLHWLTTSLMLNKLWRYWFKVSVPYKMQTQGRGRERERKRETQQPVITWVTSSRLWDRHPPLPRRSMVKWNDQWEKKRKQGQPHWLFFQRSSIECMIYPVIKPFSWGCKAMTSRRFQSSVEFNHFAQASFVRLLYFLTLRPSHLSGCQIT